MFSYFDKTFFKFFFGFLAILITSFIVTGLVLQDIDSAQKATVETAASLEFSD